MKKTLTANISGTVFHIEEDAYEKLQRYLASIRGQFTGTEGRDEIMADIEARIAELFQERLDGKRQVVNVDDVAHVIGIMGQPEDYMDSTSDDENTTRTAPNSDPNWTYGGGRKHRRLMRDTEDKWVGGVLSGVGAYFGFDPLILRLIYIALLFMGVGVLIYIILWIVVPPADSAADRLEMRGEPVTVDNLKKVFDEGADRVRAGAANVANEASDLGKRFAGSGAGPRRDHFSRTAARGVGVLGKIIGVALIIAGIVMGMMLIAGLVGAGTLTYENLTGGSGAGYFEMGGLFFASSSQAIWFVLAGILLALIPVVGLVLLGLRLVFNTKSPGWFSGMLAAVWFIALIVTMVLGIRLGNDFKRSEKVRTEVQMLQPAGQILYVNSMNHEEEDGNWRVTFNNGRAEWDADLFRTSADSIHGAWAQMDVKRSPDHNYHLIVDRKAQARSLKSSMIRASNITFKVAQTDSVLELSPWLNFPKSDKVRAQRVRFIVQVPLGKAIHLGHNIGFMLDDVDNVTNTYDGDMVGQTWTMTLSGLSRDVDPNNVPDDLPMQPTDTTGTGTNVVVSIGNWKWDTGTDKVEEDRSTASTSSDLAYKLPNVLDLLFQRM
ncbi:MAG: PspC domain-containing protein [Flavobacteriales bacterium]|nr:PspC domain-containing protein [Flavobacteriales bacterium]